MSANETTLAKLQSLAENLVPGYSLAFKIFKIFGLDVSWILQNSIVPLGVLTCIYFLYQRLKELFLDQFTASMVIESNDILFETVMSFLIDKKILAGMNSLIATTTPDERLTFAKQKVGAGRRFRFEPGEKLVWFKRNGRWFGFQRIRGDQVRTGFRQTIILTVFCSDIQPIKDLLSEAQDQPAFGSRLQTTITRPLSKDTRDRGPWATPWTTALTRPARRLKTITLSDGVKDNTITDIEEFWSSQALDRYSSCGIPYRRGYLFHGPPGTGKSSFVFAIAGYFGVNIYSISLNDPSLTDEDLSYICSNIPRYCVLLLEDLDSTDIRQGNSDDDKHHDSHRRLGISRSGLLNAIDGVASPEGRILIITTNFPHRLDAALVRPGRIDFKVEFKRASKKEIREMFLRFYSHYTEAGGEQSLESLAGQFTEEIPDELLTHAEVQGFCLARVDPKDASEGIRAVVEEAKKTKEAEVK
jgi:mitochondrial chaperone BCS1